MICDISAFSTKVELEVRILQCASEPKLIQTSRGDRYVVNTIVMDREAVKIDVAFWCDTQIEAKEKIGKLRVSKVACISGLRVANVEAAKQRWSAHPSYRLDSTPTTEIADLPNDGFPKEALCLVGFGDLMGSGEGTVVAAVAKVDLPSKLITRGDGSRTKKASITIASPTSNCTINVDLWDSMADWAESEVQVGDIIGLRGLRWSTANNVATIAGEVSRVIIPTSELPRSNVESVAKWLKENDLTNLPTYEPKPTSITWDMFDVTSDWPYNGLFSLEGTIGRIDCAGLYQDVCAACHRWTQSTSDRFYCQSCKQEVAKKTIFEPTIMIKGDYGLKRVFKGSNAVGETLFGVTASEFLSATKTNPREQVNKVNNMCGKIVHFVFYVRKNPATNAYKFLMKTIGMGPLPQEQNSTHVARDDILERATASVRVREEQQSSSSTTDDILNTLKTTLILLAGTSNKTATMMVANRVAAILENHEATLLKKSLATLELIASTLPQGLAQSTLLGTTFQLFVDNTLANTPQSERLTVLMGIMDAWQQDAFQPFLQDLLEHQLSISIPESAITPRKLPQEETGSGRKLTPKSLLLEFEEQSVSPVHGEKNKSAAEGTARIHGSPHQPEQASSGGNASDNNQPAPQQPSCIETEKNEDAQTRSRGDRELLSQPVQGSNNGLEDTSEPPTKRSKRKGGPTK